MVTPQPPAPAPVRPEPSVVLQRPVGRARAAVAGMWVLFALALVTKLAFPGWGVLVVVMMSPVLLGLPALGAGALTSLLVGRRRLQPEPPRWLVALAWLLGGAMFVAAAVFPDSGDAAESTSLLLALAGTDVSSPWMAPVASSSWLVAAGAAVVAVVVWVRARAQSRRERRPGA